MPQESVNNENTGLLAQTHTEQTHDVFTEDSTIEHDLKPLNMRRYFPFYSPTASFLCLQMCLLVQSFYLAMFLIHYAYVILIEDGVSSNIPTRWFVLVCCLIPATLICFVFFPLTIPDFTILYSIENQTNKHCLKLEKMKKLFGKEEVKKEHEENVTLEEIENAH